MTRSSIVGLLVEILLVILGVMSITGGETYLAFYSMVAWTFLALVYVAAILWAAWRLRLLPDAQTIEEEPGLRLNGWIVSLLGLTPVVAAFVGLLGGLTEITVSVGVGSNLPEILGTNQEETLKLVRAAFDVVKVLMCVLGWSLLHISYARHYERLDHLHGPAFRFPSAKDPELTDYLYFAITIGTTFATSDVNITSRRLRWTVTVHSILAFFYNAIVMAVAFKIITDSASLASSAS